MPEIYGHCITSCQWNYGRLNYGVHARPALLFPCEPTSGGKCAFLAANVHKRRRIIYIYGVTHCGNILSNWMIQCSAVTHMVSIGLRVGEKLVKKYCRLIYTHAYPSVVLQLLLMNKQRSCSHCRHSLCERLLQFRSVAFCVADTVHISSSYRFANVRVSCLRWWRIVFSLCLSFVMRTSIRVCAL